VIGVDLAIELEQLAFAFREKTVYKARGTPTQPGENEAVEQGGK
jgi:hypothetical protein